MEYVKYIYTRTLWFVRISEYNFDFLERQGKRKNNNEAFDNLHIILLIHVCALAKIREVK